MCIDGIIPLTMIDDKHLAIPGKTIGKYHFPLLYCFYFRAHWRFYIEAVAKHLGSKFSVFGLAEAGNPLPFHRPLEPAAHSIEPSTGRHVAWLNRRSSCDLVD